MLAAPCSPGGQNVPRCVWFVWCALAACPVCLGALGALGALVVFGERKKKSERNNADIRIALLRGRNGEE